MYLRQLLKVPRELALELCRLLKQVFKCAVFLTATHMKIYLFNFKLSYKEYMFYYI